MKVYETKTDCLDGMIKKPHVLSSIGRLSDEVLDLSLPEVVGCVSNFFSTIKEDEIKQTPIKYIIFALLQFEASDNLGQEAYNKFHHIIEDHPELQFLYLSSVAKKALREDDVIHFAEATLGYIVMLNKSKLSNQEWASKEGQMDTLKDNEFKIVTSLKDYFFIASVILLEKGRLSQQVIDSWKSTLNKNQCFDLDNWFKALGGILISKDIEAEDVMQHIFVDIRQDEMIRFIAALGIINDNATNSPINLIDCQSFVLVRYKAFYKSEPDFTISLGKMVVKSWLRMIKNYPGFFVNLDENLSDIQRTLQRKIRSFDDIVQIIKVMRVVINLHQNSFTDSLLNYHNE